MCVKRASSTRQNVQDNLKMASTSNIQTPGEFDFNKPELWPRWVKRFERYISITGVSEKPDKDRINLLCYTMGEKSEEILIQVMPVITASTTFAEVKQKLDSYFSPKKNVIFERFKFNSRVQEPGKSVDSFVTTLYSLAETCEYGAIKEELIRDRIAIGICDTRASERMQLINDLTLEKALEIARQSEIQAKEGRKMRQEIEEETEVNRVVQREKNPHKQNRNDNKNRREGRVCGRCGNPDHTQGRRCPAMKSVCHRCKKEGHWERVCRSKGIRHVEKEIGSDEEEAEADVGYAFIGAASDSTHEKGFKFRAYVSEFSKSLHFIVDTGADITCISDECIPYEIRSKICKTHKIISGPDGKKLPVMGFFYVRLIGKRKEIQAKTYVIRGLKQNLLGKPEIKKLNLIREVNIVRENCLNNIISEFSEVFKGIGQFKKELNIETKEDAKPFFPNNSQNCTYSVASETKKRIG